MMFDSSLMENLSSHGFCSLTEYNESISLFMFDMGDSGCQSQMMMMAIPKQADSSRGCTVIQNLNADSDVFFFNVMEYKIKINFENEFFFNQRLHR